MALNTRNESLRVPYDGSDFEVYEACPVGEGAYPPIVVIHEWWGLNEHVRDVARRLASEGFRALAPDLYDGRVTGDADRAAAMMTALDTEEAVAKLSAAMNAARIAEEDRAGVLGFCMGGSLTLALAAGDPRIRAAVPFYGQVPGDDVLAGLKGPVLYFAAGRDNWITREETDRLAAWLKSGGPGGEVVRYADADHAFFNDTRPEVYRAELAAEAWKRTVVFFREQLA